MVCDESVENLTGANSAVMLYSNPVQTGPSQSEIQSVDVSRRLARTAARPSRFRDDHFETQFRPELKDKVRQVHFDPGKGESLAVEKKQPHAEREARERQSYQTLGKGESNGSKLGNSKQIGPAYSSLIHLPNGDQYYLIRKNGPRLGWPTWPKIRFKSHAQNRWKSRFRMLSRRSIRFKAPTGNCKLSRGAYRVRMLKRRSTIRFRTQYQPNTMVYKRQQQLLRSGKTELKNPLDEGTFRVRILNQSSSTLRKSSKPHVQPDPVHDHFQSGKSEVLEICTSGNVRDCTRYIQAVILHHHQSDWSQKGANGKEGLLRNNYGLPAIKHELSSALHSTGAQIQSHTAGTNESDNVKDLINGQRPPSALNARAVDKGVKSDTPSSGDK